MAYPTNFYQQPQLYQQQPVNNGLVPVPSETVARNYPVGYGQSVSFRDENAPYLYTKTMGFSQLDTPHFEKYRLVKEASDLTNKGPESNVLDKTISYAKKADVERLDTEVKKLKEEVAALKEGV